MSSALLVQVNDLGAWLHSLVHLRMPASGPVTLRWAERRSLRLVSSANQRSTRLSQLELAGVKCRWKRGCRTSQSLMASVGDLPRSAGPGRVGQGVHPSLREPHPPLADGLPRHPGAPGDPRQRRDPRLLRTGQHHPRPLGKRLRRRPLPRQRLQQRALGISQNQRDKLRTRHPASLLPAKLSMTQDTNEPGRPFNLSGPRSDGPA
jgi:hypothetical protein